MGKESEREGGKEGGREGMEGRRRAREREREEERRRIGGGHCTWKSPTHCHYQGASIHMKMQEQPNTTTLPPNWTLSPIVSTQQVFTLAHTLLHTLPANEGNVCVHVHVLES